MARTLRDLASNAQRLQGNDADVQPSVAAPPQSATLDWRETYGATGEEVVFTVGSIAVTEHGWNARVGIENRSSVGWELEPGATPEGSFGLQLFETGDKQELEERNQNGTLPASPPGILKSITTPQQSGFSWWNSAASR